MDVRLAQQYRSWMVALLPLTLGLGTLVLWARALRWPRRLERDGMRLRNGRFVRWKDITRIGVTKREFDEETVKLDLYFAGGSARVPLRYLQDGERTPPPCAAIIRGRARIGRSVCPIHPVVSPP
jgi:hypothetical protein